MVLIGIKPHEHLNNYSQLSTEPVVRKHVTNSKIAFELLSYFICIELIFLKIVGNTILDIVSFFPGQVLNRFARDTGYMDDLLPKQAHLVTTVSYYYILKLK